jgi:acyl-CoA synthetase (AMP-forming)/AMP-acid ligase II
MATAKIGAILVCINPAYRLYELEYALNKSGCRAIVSAEQFKSSKYLEMLYALAPSLKMCPPGKLRSVKLPKLGRPQAPEGTQERAASRRPDQYPVHFRHDRQPERGDADALQYPE